MVDSTNRPLTAPEGGTAPLEGRVVGLHLKPETPGERGLPKRPVSEARLKRSGLEGDFNRYRHEEKHDDDGMALLLMPSEMIEQLNREGWPVRPGDLGENITSAGIPYDRFQPGTTLTIGEAEVVVTKACDPCTILYTLPYVGPARGPEFLKTMLHRRGWYLRVLREGTSRLGDSVRLIP